MRLLFSSVIILSSIALFMNSSLAEDKANTDSELQLQDQDHQQTPQVIDINLTSANDGWHDDDSNDQIEFVEKSPSQNLPPQEQYNDIKYTDSNLDETNNSSKEILTHSLALEDNKPELPGKDVNYHINLHASTNFLIEGRARSDIGKILFKSKLMPSNEVKLTLKLKQGELEDIELIAYFDLANFTMDLDGGKRILNKDHKILLKLTSAHLQPKIEAQYKDYDIPEHALMLVQMIGYWSVSPEGYVHEKRSIVSE